MIGRNTSGSLSLSEDERGLHIQDDLPDTSYARDLAAVLERGDVNQMSFGFQTLQDDWRFEGAGLVIRELIEVKLFDISPVTFPAYTQTDVHSMHPPEARDYFSTRIKNIVRPDTEALRAIRAEHALMRQKMTEKLWF